MKIKAANGVARILKAEGIPWVSCYPTNHVNNALGEEGVPILMMGEERFAVAVADGFSRVTCGKQIGACTVMANLNAAGIQMAYGAIAQAWEDLAAPRHRGRRGAGREPAHALRHGGGVQVGHQVVGQGRPPIWCPTTCAAPSPSSARAAGSGAAHHPARSRRVRGGRAPYAPVKGWRSGPDPDDVRSAVRTLLAARIRCSTWAKASSTRMRHPSSCSSPSWRRCRC